jgi:hypothetical protein
VEKLLRSVYVDNIVSGTESEEESQKIFEFFREILAVGGFNLRKFVSSGPGNLSTDCVDSESWGGGSKGIGSHLESNTR